MRIAYDAQKAQLHQAKHGISLAEAVNLEWDTLYTFEDARHNYGETRMIGYALNGNRLFCVIYTDRGNTRRIISLRKANNREIRQYG